MSEKLHVFIPDRSHQTKPIVVFVKAIRLVTTVDIYLNYSNFQKEPCRKPGGTQSVQMFMLLSLN